MSNRTFKKNKAIIAIIAICVIVIIAALLSTHAVNEQYNNGICPKCGGRYELFDIASTKSTICYYYQCQSCKYTIMLGGLMNPQ